MRITEVTMFILVILLTLSVGLNVFQYTGRKVNAEPEIVQVSDTVVRIDTIIHTVTHQVTIDRPVPVYIDTISNIRTYRDTIFHPFGTIKREEMIMGEILKQDLNIDLKIPETLRTLTVMNSTTQTVRSPLVFVTGGFRYSPSEQSLVPTIGLLGIISGYRLGIGANIGLNGTVWFNFCIKLRK